LQLPQTERPASLWSLWAGRKSSLARSPMVLAGDFTLVPKDLVRRSMHAFRFSRGLRPPRSKPMTTRGRFLTAGVSIAAGAASLSSCSAQDDAYAAAVRETWRPFDDAVTERRALQHEFVRYATLAPSSHNTQCWRFRLERDRITIQPDFSRRCPAVDPDDHHLFVSLGCATEPYTGRARARFSK